MGEDMMLVLIPVVAVAIYIFKCINILKEYERGVVFRLGRVLKKEKGPGLIIIFWPIDRIVKVALRLIALDVPPQDIITRDNVSVKVNAVVYFRVVEPIKCIVEVENYFQATSQIAQTNLRSILGGSNLDELLAEREKINFHLQEILDRSTDPWGIKVTNVEIKHVDLPQEMQRAMAKQAEAERERRAKIIHAEGEFQAAKNLSEASNIMAKSPISLQLRYLQTLSDIAAENNSTVVFPIPIELLRYFDNIIKRTDNKDTEPM